VIDGTKITKERISNQIKEIIMAKKCVKLRMKDGMSRGAAIKACYPNADSTERKKISRGMKIQKVAKGAINAAVVGTGVSMALKNKKKKY